MKLYRTANGLVAEHEEHFYPVNGVSFNELVCDSDIHKTLMGVAHCEPPLTGVSLGELQAPIEDQDVWAAGVTYYRSRSARIEESQGGGDFYDRVYSAERPELFFKSGARNVVGSDKAVAIRQDATWSVPEPELALLISPKAEIIGYTIGNDMSSRDIEGENPLYLPQAKVYDRSCALGPCILIQKESISPATSIKLEILREGKSAFSGSTNLTELKREL